MAEQFYLLTIVFLISSLSSCFCQNIFDKLLEDVSSCNSACENIGLAQKIDQEDLLGACKRGCRLYSIIDFATDNDANETRSQCEGSCNEAYDKSSTVDACNYGCKNQQPYSLQQSKEKQFDYYNGVSLSHSITDTVKNVLYTTSGMKGQESEEEAELPQSIHVLYPLFMMHSMCNSMMDHLSTRVYSSWTVYMQTDSGELMIVESQPEISLDFNDTPADEPENEEYKTSNYLETNIRSVDDSATPDFSSYSMDPSGQRVYESQHSSDWLSCVSKKTGLPRLMLSLTIFISAMMMIWLCLSSAATAPEHRIKKQKLSLYGDLEVIESMKNKGLQHVHPQEGAVQFGPLPIKVCVEKV